MKGESGKERSKGGERENEKGENEDRKRQMEREKKVWRNQGIKQKKKENIKRHESITNQNPQQ